VRSSLRLGAGELTRLPSSSPLPVAPPPPPLRRVRPELEAIGCVVELAGCVAKVMGDAPQWAQGWGRLGCAYAVDSFCGTFGVDGVSEGSGHVGVKMKGAIARRLCKF
jgi:hypothetical protein